MKPPSVNGAANWQRWYAAIHETQNDREVVSLYAQIVQPVLDRLAQETGELVRLGVIDGERQTWIAKSQGARSGLRYDPDMGRDAPLFYTASGHAWARDF